MTNENAVPNLLIKITKDHEDAKRLWLRLDAIRAAEVKDGFAVFTLSDDVGETSPAVTNAVTAICAATEAGYEAKVSLASSLG